MSTLIQDLRCPESQVKDLSTLIQGLRCPESQVKDLSTLIQGLRCPESRSQRLEHNNVGPAMPSAPSRKRLEHEGTEPRKPEKYRPGEDRPGKRSKQNNQSQVRRCPPNVERTSKGNLKDMNELAIEALMDHKVPLRSILDLCHDLRKKCSKTGRKR